MSLRESDSGSPYVPPMKLRKVLMDVSQPRIPFPIQELTTDFVVREDLGYANAHLRPRRAPRRCLQAHRRAAAGGRPPVLRHNRPRGGAVRGCGPAAGAEAD